MADERTGTLHLVATPIGNLEDITLRALRVLAEADLIFAEDTRRTRILLDRHGITARPLSLNAHNEAARVERALRSLREGRSVALASDAGTPLISDPGERLVAAALAEGHLIEPLPGPSAVLAALAGSGLPTQPFTFLGFAPRRDAQRRRLFESLRDRRETLVMFESPHRLAATLAALRDVLGRRPACVARELTKLHEEWTRGPLDELVGRFAQGTRGELTLVVGGCEGEASTAWTNENVEAEIRSLLEAGERPREIAASLATATGLPRRELYARAVAARESSERL